MKKKALKWFGIFMGIMIVLTFVSRGIYAYRLAKVSTTGVVDVALDHSIKGDGSVLMNTERAVCVLPGIRIDEVCVKEGQVVDEGTVLLKLNKEDLAEQIKLLKNDVSEMQLKLSDLQTNAAKDAAVKQTDIDRASEDYKSDAASADRKITEAAQDLQEAIDERDKLGSKDSYESSVSGNDAGAEWERLYDGLDDAVVAAQRKYDDCVEAKNNAIKDAGRKIQDVTTPNDQDSTGQITAMGLEEKKLTLQKYIDLEQSGTEIASTSHGMINKINVAAGDITPQTSSIMIADMSEQLIFSALISKEEQKKVSIGDYVSLSFHNGKDKTDEAKVLEMEKVDETGSQYRIKVNVDSSLATIGETGTFEIKNISENRSQCVPLTALHSDGLYYYVYVVNSRNSILGEELKVSLRKVIIADKNDHYAALDNSGLTDEDSIVISSSKDIADGDTVRLLEQ